MKARRIRDRLGALLYFVFSPVLWLVDATLQAFWPMEDPEPPDDLDLRQRVLWEIRFLAVTTAIVVAGVAVLLVLVAAVASLTT